jgi:hypothetical protein
MIFLFSLDDEGTATLAWVQTRLDFDSSGNMLHPRRIEFINENSQQAHHQVVILPIKKSNCHLQ